MAGCSPEDGALPKPKPPPPKTSLAVITVYAPETTGAEYTPCGRANSASFSTVLSLISRGLVDVVVTPFIVSAIGLFSCRELRNFNRRTPVASWTSMATGRLQANAANGAAQVTVRGSRSEEHTSD